MNELYIYKKIRYKQVLKSANILFNKKHSYLFCKTVMAKKNSTYTISINKNSIRICYWDEYSEAGLIAKKLIKQFLSDNFSGETLVISKSGTCDVLDDLHNIKTIQLEWGNK